MLFDFTQKAGPGTLTVTVKPKGIVLKWSKSPDKLHSHYNVYRYTSQTDAANDANGEFLDDTVLRKYRDDDELSAGTAYYYRVSSVDSYANESTKGPVASATYKLMLAGDMLLTDGSNLIPDPNLEDMSIWSKNAAAADLVQLINDNGSSPSKYKIRTSGSGAKILTPYIIVEPNREYLCQAYIGPNTGLSGDYWLMVEYYKLDAGGNPVLDQSASGVGQTISAVTLFGFEISVPAGIKRIRLIALASSSSNNQMNLSGPVVRIKADTALLVDAAVSTPKLKANAVTLVERTNYGSPDSVNAGNTKIMVEQLASHGTDAQSVEFDWQFKNNSGGGRLVDLQICEGSTVLDTIANVAMADNELMSGSYIRMNPAGSSTNFNVKVTTTGSAVTLSARYAATKTFKR
jgi:hypothetical protein